MTIIGLILALAAVLIAIRLLFDGGPESPKDDDLAAFCAELLARNVWLLAECERLSAAVAQTAMQLPSPQVARLARFALQQRAGELQRVAMLDPRQRPVLDACEAAVERLGRLT